MAKYDSVDQSIDRALDDFGRFLRRAWWLLLLCVLLAWWLIANGPPLLAQLKPVNLVAPVIQVALLLCVVVASLAAIVWFIGRPRVYWVMPGETSVGFDDYKGNPEVLEGARRIVALLKGVRGFREMSGEISQGLLLIGPPGTGKRYLARCISTEANLPFGYASAATFRGMFWGMDVLIVRSLYRKAHRYAREYGGCVLFIDALDAISAQSNTMGTSSGSGALNELLLRMDPPPPMENAWWKQALRALGFSRGRALREPVLTIGATNSPESLDPALPRPGRFDRAITVAPPSDANRGEVIAYYLARVRHEDIALEQLAVDLRGYTPLAIKLAINEAAVLAHFDGRDHISYQDIRDAHATHEHGIRAPRSLPPLEQRRMAYHEIAALIARAVGGDLAESGDLGELAATARPSAPLVSATDAKLNGHIPGRAMHDDLAGVPANQPAVTDTKSGA